MSSLRAVRRSSLMTRMVLSSICWMVCLRSVISFWRLLISVRAFLWLPMSWFSMPSMRLSRSAMRFSPMERRACRTLTWSIIGFWGAAIGFLGAKNPLGAGGCAFGSRVGSAMGKRLYTS